jgi:hypothetical protein
MFISWISQLAKMSNFVTLGGLIIIDLGKTAAGTSQG